MAFSVFGISCKSHFYLRPPLRHCARQVRMNAVAAAKMFVEGDRLNKNNSGEWRVKNSEWKKFNSKELGVSTSSITKPIRRVLNLLRQKGFEVYLVGGCVRDLILKRVPKDFDIITSAELKEVVRTFSHCEIVGKRFPICHVHIDDSIVEVSSFNTSGRRHHYGDMNSAAGRSMGADVDPKDYLRWRNCLQRDLTINGFMFDPYARVIYDYVGGMEDIRKAKVRTIIPASTSFREDCARILRAIRIAARLRFRLAKETAQSVNKSYYSVLRLGRGRLLMEMNYMLAYGSAEASLRLLWKFGLLDILLPIQAAYFVHCGFGRRDKGSNMLLSLFSNLDKHLAPDRPCHSSLWVAILAFHQALSTEPRDPMVVAAFSLAVHNGGNILEAVNIAKRICRPHDSSYHELLEPRDMDEETLLNEIMDLGGSVIASLRKITDEHFVSQAMSQYPQAPYSDLVFIPFALYLKACRILECVRRGKEHGFLTKQGRNINSEILALGSLAEVRHVLARIFFDTVYPQNLSRDHTSSQI